MRIAEQVAAHIQSQRQIQRDGIERAEIAREVREQWDREDKAAQAREARGEAGVTAWIRTNSTKITVEHRKRLISIRMNHADTVVRDTAIEGVRRLMSYITRDIRSGVISARNIGRAGAGVVEQDSQWLARLLDLDLADARRFKLVSVTDLKGRPVKLPKATPAPAPTRQTSGHRDQWLSGGEPSAPSQRTMRAR